MPYYGSRSDHPLDDSPLDLAPRRLIVPRRRLRELSTDHTIYRTPDLLVNNERTNNRNRNRNRNGAMVTTHPMSSDIEQPESPPVINYIIKSTTRYFFYAIALIQKFIRINYTTQLLILNTRKSILYST